MIFHTTINQKKARQVAYKQNADRIMYYVIMVIIMFPTSIGVFFSYGTSYKVQAVIFMALTLMIGFVIFYGIFHAKCKVFSAYKIKEYILTVEFTEDEIIISTNLNEKTTKINYDKIRKCIISEDYLIFVTKDDTSFEIEKAAIAEMGLEQFKEFVKEKMPQVEGYMNFIEI